MSPLLFPSLGTTQLQTGCLGNDRVLLQTTGSEVTHSCQRKTLQMFFNLSTEQAFLCHPSRETVFAIAHLGNFVLFQNMLQQTLCAVGSCTRQTNLLTETPLDTDLFLKKRLNKIKSSWQHRGI